MIELPPADLSTNRQRGIGYAAFIGMVGLSASAALTLVRSKVTAVVLGPVGLGIGAEVLQLVTVAVMPVSVVNGPALVSAIANHRAHNDDEKVGSIYDTAVTTAVSLSIIGGIAAIVAGRWLLPEPWGPSAWPLTLLVAAGLIGLAWHTVAIQTLIAAGELKTVTIVSVTSSLMAATFVIVGTVKAGLTGQLFGLALAHWLSIPISVTYAARLVAGVKRRPRWRLDRSYVKWILSVGATALIAQVTAQGVLVAIRSALERSDGTASNGLFQAAWTVGTSYYAIVYLSLGQYAAPRFAAAQDTDALVREVTDVIRFVLRIGTPIILIGIAFGASVLRILYSPSFVAASELLGYIMVGDLLKSVSFAYAAPLLYRGQAKAFMVTEVVGTGFMALATTVLVPRYGLVGVGYAQVFTHVVYLVVAAYTLKAACNVPIAYRKILLTLAMTVVLFLLFRFNIRYEWVKWGIAALALLWVYRLRLHIDIYAAIRVKLTKLKQ